jgi:TPR repeat protein
MLNLSDFRSVLLAVLFISHPVQADIDSAMDDYGQGRFNQAFDSFKILAEAGNVEAQYNLAFMFYGGEGTKQNYYKAFYWFHTAALAGHSSAQDLLAYMYSHGYGTSQDRLRAYVWYSIASTHGQIITSMVRDSIESEMGRAEQAQADLMISEYSKIIQAKITRE